MMKTESSHIDANRLYLNINRLETGAAQLSNGVECMKEKLDRIEAKFDHLERIMFVMTTAIGAGEVAILVKLFLG